MTRTKTLVLAMVLCLVSAGYAFAETPEPLSYHTALRLLGKLEKGQPATREQWAQLAQAFYHHHRTHRNRAIADRSLLLAGKAALSGYRRHGALEDLDLAIRYLSDFTKVHRRDQYFIQGLKELKFADSLRRNIANRQPSRSLEAFSRPIGREPPYAKANPTQPSHRTHSPNVAASGPKIASNGNWDRPAHKYTGNPFWTPRNGHHDQSSNALVSPFSLGIVSDILPSRHVASAESPKLEVTAPSDNAFLAPQSGARDSTPRKQPSSSVPTSSPQGQSESSTPPQVVASVSPGEKPEPELAKKSEYSGKTHVVVIDPGHGGRDPGAVSADGTLKEKDLTLDVAKRVKAALERNNPGITVALTRTDDRFMSLEERSAAANALNADLFISIHCNSDTDTSSHGTETYYLSKATSPRAMRAAARENGLSPAKMSDLQATLLDLMVTSKKTESEALALAVSNSLEQVIPKARHRGVKQAPFYVLLGAKMPAILVECAFMSNVRECRKLHDPKYLDTIAQGLSNGAESYLKGLGE